MQLDGNHKSSKSTFGADKGRVNQKLDQIFKSLYRQPLKGWGGRGAH